ncbi:Importin alpha subunit (Karyopherin alpha subunit) (Serine-rich RNA polymerase I suppressor protein) [Tulasnella sp. 417]|nr:Importin alpha subunit (Karyopherin alpha subunit) (Serine-rich RNA polymerase I suppressor protein) [Tulasnella sp. 417]
MNSPDSSTGKGGTTPRQENGGQDQADQAELGQYLTRDQKIESANKIHRLIQLVGRPAKNSAQMIIDSGILPTIIEMLSSRDSRLASDCAWILINVSAGMSEQTSAVVAGGAIPKLITLSCSMLNEARIRPLTTLRNILADSSGLRELLIKEGGLEPALEVLESPERYSSKCVDTAAWMIARATEEESDRLILQAKTKPMLPILLKFILSQNEDTAESVTSAIKALRSLTRYEMIDQVINSGILPRLIPLSRCVTENNGMQGDALQLLHRILFKRPENIQAAIENGLLDALQVCIRTRTAVTPACWLAERVAWGSIPQVTTLVQSPLIFLLVEVVFDETLPIKSRQEAARVLSSSVRRITASDPHLLDPLLKARCIEALSEMLPLDDGSITRHLLLGIDSFIRIEWGCQGEAMARFKASDGIHHLREIRLKSWAREGPVKGRAQEMLRTYFPEWSKYPRV